MEQNKIRLGRQSGYNAGALDGMRFNGTPHKDELAAARAAEPAATPFDLSSCCPAGEDGEANSCLQCVNTILTCVGNYIYQLIESVKSCLGSWFLTPEEAQVTAFLNKWEHRQFPKRNIRDGADFEMVRAEFERDFNALCPKSAFDYDNMTAAQYVRRAVAQNDIVLVYNRRLDEENPDVWWDYIVSKVICHNPDHPVIMPLVLRTFREWLKLDPEARKVDRVVDDEQVAASFVALWEGCGLEPLLWQRSFSCLPDTVKEVARAAFFDAHPDLHWTEFPRPPIVNSALLIENDELDRKRKIAASKDGIILQYAADAAVLKAVRDWKPKREGK